MLKKLFLILIATITTILIPVTSCFAFEKGIYLTQNTVENNVKINYFIKNAKKSGINAFVMDVKRQSSKYEAQVKRVKDNGIRFVARIVVFPGGGSIGQVRNKNAWQKPLKLAKYAVKLGADAIQLDYIRYKTSRAPSRQNVTDIYNVIQHFKANLPHTEIDLQIDVFGITASKPSYRIGQIPAAFTDLVDVICPMVYPSHYEPYRYHSQRPYKTIKKSLDDLKKQIAHAHNVKIIPFIEVTNYRYPMSKTKLAWYINEEIRAVIDSDVEGFYVWNANNRYSILFQVLQNQK